jgi:hypothetical protein
MKFFRLLLIVPIISTSLFALTDKELAISINLSGKQRMLSQKMTKESFLIRSNIDKDLNIQKLTKSSQLFDKTLKGLMQGDKSLQLVAIKDQKIQEQLKKVQKLWQPFYKEIQNIITGKASKESYATLEQNNIPLLKEMNKVVGLYTKQSRGKGKLTLANDINLAGKQRMLTQKMGKDLLFISNGIKPKVYQEDFKQSRELFSNTLNGLFEGSKKLNLKGTKLPKIVKQLKVVKKLWNEEQPLLDTALKGKEIKKAINALDTTLIEMNKGVILYTKSINRQKQRLKLSSLINNFMNKNKILKKRVNLSGKQRMLTQRITKLALMIDAGIDPQESKKRLQKFSDLYAKTLNGFKNGDKDLGCIPTTSTEIRNQIAYIEKRWKPFYEHVQKIIEGKDKGGTSLAYLVKENEDLLKDSNELVKQYEKSNKSQNYLDKARLHIVNVAGRQRMLTQKMTKEKLLIAKGKSEYNSKLKKTIKLFDTSLTALINGDTKQNIVKPTNKKMKAQLAIVAKLWKELKPLYEKEMIDKKELAIIIKQNPILLKEMNRAVQISEKAIEY